MAADAAEQELLRLLPPLPTPDRKTQRGESIMGSLGVLTIVALCVAGTYGGCHIMEFEGPHYWPSAPTTLLTLVYAEAALAFACLVGLLCADPGEVKRSEATCLPMPEEISLALRAGVPPASTINIECGERSYCVRCFVWRTPEPSEHLATASPLQRCLARCCLALACDAALSPGGHRFHHCSTCQRCFANFDHHCGFFGRCIAGKGCGGNMGFFKAIICMGSIGAFTAGTSLVIGMLSTEGYTYFMGIGLAIYIGLYAVGLMCSGFFMLFRRLHWQLTSKARSSTYTAMTVTDSARATYGHRGQASNAVAAAEEEAEIIGATL